MADITLTNLSGHRGYLEQEESMRREGYSPVMSFDRSESKNDEEMVEFLRELGKMKMVLGNKRKLKIGRVGDEGSPTYVVYVPTERADGILGLDLGYIEQILSRSPTKPFSFSEKELDPDLEGAAV